MLYHHSTPRNDIQTLFKKIMYQTCLILFMNPFGYILRFLVLSILISENKFSLLALMLIIWNNRTRTSLSAYQIRCRIQRRTRSVL